MTVELEEFAPNRWRVKRAPRRIARAYNLPHPYVISDTMEPTEQVDGNFYTSKKQFRAVGRALGLIEVGNEKIPPKQRTTNDLRVRRKRREDLHIALQKYKAGQRPTPSGIGTP